jgi:hypothetical protein
MPFPRAFLSQPEASKAKARQHSNDGAILKLRRKSADFRSQGGMNFLSDNPVNVAVYCVMSVA